MSNLLFWAISAGLMIGGLISAQSFIISKNPKAEESIKKLSAYSKPLGVILFVAGIIEVFDVIINWSVIEILFQYAPVTGIVFIAAILLSIAIGLILSGEALTSKLANPEKINNFKNKIESKKVFIGIIAVICGTYLILFKLIKFRL